LKFTEDGDIFATATKDGTITLHKFHDAVDFYEAQCDQKRYGSNLVYMSHEPSSPLPLVTLQMYVREQHVVASYLEDKTMVKTTSSS
jgi:hypothetical protein